MKKISHIFLIAFGIILLIGCTSYFEKQTIDNVGLLLEGSINDHDWNKKGYIGLQSIENDFDVNGYVKENIQTKQEVIKTVDEFVRNGVNLIFGHSNLYGKHFVDIAHNFPEVHFVYFNGSSFGENVTSINFNSHAMGFFGGMVASKMSTTNKIGVIAAYEWQPEVEGFYEGAKYQNPASEVEVNFINSWNANDVAIEIYDKMVEKEVDVIYPTGDSFSTSVIQRASEDGIYAIGYVSDQSNIDETAVLTSTVQHVDELYKIAAEQFNVQSLDGGILTVDFQDGAISLGEFSPDVPRSFQMVMKEYVNEYIETSLLPNER